MTSAVVTDCFFSFSTNSIPMQTVWVLTAMGVSHQSEDLAFRAAGRLANPLFAFRRVPSSSFIGAFDHIFCQEILWMNADLQARLPENCSRCLNQVEGVTARWAVTPTTLCGRTGGRKWRLLGYSRTHMERRSGGQGVRRRRVFRRTTTTAHRRASSCITRRARRPTRGHCTSWSRRPPSARCSSISGNTNQ